VKDPRGPREDLDLPGGRDATTRDDREETLEKKNAVPRRVGRRRREAQSAQRERNEDGSRETSAVPREVHVIRRV
jgi:hypothetical protein